MRIPVSILGLVLSSSAWAQTIIHAGQLFDAAAGVAIEGATIVVDGDRIADVQSGYAGEPDIDLTGAFVMPGWIDMHVHIGGELSPDSFVEEFTHGTRGPGVAGGSLRGTDPDGGIHHRTGSGHRPPRGPVGPPRGRRRPHRRVRASSPPARVSPPPAGTRIPPTASTQRCAAIRVPRKGSSTVSTTPTRPCAPATRKVRT